MLLKFKWYFANLAHVIRRKILCIKRLKRWLKCMGKFSIALRASDMQIKYNLALNRIVDKRQKQ